MNFDFSEEQKLLQKTARDYLEEHCPLESARAVLEGSGTHSEALGKGVAEMGWLGAAVPESYGGAGFGRLELSLVAMELGRALAPIPFGPSVYLLTEALCLAGSDEQKQRYLPRLASGELIGTFAHTEQVGRVDAISTRFESGKVSGTKLPVPDAQVAGLALTVVTANDGTRLALVDLSGDGAKVEALECIDGSRPQARLTLNDAPAELLGDSGTDEAFLSHLIDRAAVLCAFEQIGGAERAFEITREFTLNRYAFGRPIASFQALKHRMADIYGAIQLATSNAYYGAWALSTGDEELATSACGARICASAAFDLAALLSLALGGPGEWRERLIQRLEN